MKERHVLITGNGYSGEEAEAALLNVMESDTELYLKTNTKAWVHVFKLDMDLVIELVRHTVVFNRAVVEECSIEVLQQLMATGYLQSNNFDVQPLENGILLTFK